jgi:hypothetical protein
MMDEEVYGVYWGVFFEDSGRKYLVDVHDDEGAAHSVAAMYDEDAFARAAAETDTEVEFQDFRGKHYVEPISAELVEEVREELDRGVVVEVE